MSGKKHQSASDEASEFFDTYLEYNRVLRTWFVAFGIGGPALFLVNDEIATRLSEAGQLRFVVILFLLGTAAQVVGAFINKVANWCVYKVTLDGDDEPNWFFRFAEWINGQFVIDVVLDLITIVVFGIAAWEVLTVFANVVQP